MQIFLENEELEVIINSFGAELSSIRGKATGQEYLWNADPVYWKRSAPLLFPIVGALKNNQYTYGGKVYSMEPHGFARDMEFDIISNNVSEAWFSLKSNDFTLAKYPFAFTLEIGYRLDGKKLLTIWRVINDDDKNMYFSIGGHGAFMCPLTKEKEQTDYYLSFDNIGNLFFSQINENSLIHKEKMTLDTKGGMMPISKNLFDEGVLIIENNQAHTVSLCNCDQTPYLTVTFDAPLFGLWSPAGKNAPFICIEPWYGRCDKENFSGTLAEREYGNHLNPHEIFQKEYSIEILH